MAILKFHRTSKMTDKDRLQWVLTFSRHGLDGLTPEQLATLGDDLRHVVALPWASACQHPPMPLEQLRTLQAEIRHGIAVVLADPVDFMTFMERREHRAQFSWELPRAMTYLMRVQFPATGPKSVRVVRISEPDYDWDERTAILSGVADLLIFFGEQLSACAVCGQPFLRRRRQTYCSERCGWTMRNGRRLDRKKRQQQARTVPV